MIRPAFLSFDDGRRISAGLFLAIGGDALVVPAVPVVYGAAPASAYWIAVAVALLVSGFTSRLRHGALLALGALTVAAGLVVCVLAGASPLLAIVGRAASGFGIGIVMLASQDAYLGLADAAHQAGATARYLAIFFAAQIVGSFSGGPLVGHWGLPAAAGAGAVVALIGAVIAWPARVEEQAAPRQAHGNHAPWRINRRFSLFLLLMALPTRAVNGGLIFALPVLLAAKGCPPETIAAVAAAYPAIMLFCPLAGRYVEPVVREASILGQILSAASLVAAAMIVANAPERAVPFALLASLLLGLGQMAAMPAQTSLALTTALPLPRPVALGILRAMERLGLAAGPAILAISPGIDGLARQLDHVGAVSILAAVIFAGLGMRRFGSKGRA